MHTYRSLRDLPQNYSLLELVEAEQKCSKHLEESATTSQFCGDSCCASTIDESDIGSQGDEHHSCGSWFDKIAKIRDDLDKIKGYETWSKLNNILSTCYEGIK